jgi:hypothetical protein
MQSIEKFALGQKEQQYSIAAIEILQGHPVGVYD